MTVENDKIIMDDGTIYNVQEINFLKYLKMCDELKTIHKIKKMFGGEIIK